MKLTQQQFANARKFLQIHARPLERALFRFYFQGGAREEVLRELASYQNPDGGFGHGSEPDLRTPDSSAIATSHRLQLLRELQVDAGHPLVHGAMEYLRTTCDQQEHVWPIIPPTANNAPHAGWWTTKDLAKSWNGFRANPTAELAGYFFVFGLPADEPFRQAVLRGTLDFLAARPPDMHELLCYVRLAEMIELPEAAQKQIAAAVFNTVERDPAKWAKYGLRPLTVVKSPSSPYYAGLREAVDANLDYLVSEQGDDGAWSPTWNWGGMFPEAWPQARRDWQSVLTVEALKVLRAFGRI